MAEKGEFRKRIVDFVSQAKNIRSKRKPPEELKPDTKIRGFSADSWLDALHTKIVERELERQSHEPFIPTLVLKPEVVQQEAADLLRGLSRAVDLWHVGSEVTKEDGTVLKNYQTRLKVSSGKEIFYEVQIVYREDTPIFGNLTETRPDPEGGLQQYYFQARTEKEEVDPSIYYISHPFHHEELGKPQEDTTLAVAKSYELISHLPPDDKKILEFARNEKS